MKIKNSFLLVAVLVASLLSICLYALLSYTRQTQGKDIVLELGVFAGPYWDVTDEDYYKLVDKAIEKFEQNNPGVHVHYESGVRMIDYSEWLSERILKGETPDVMIIPSRDFNMLISLKVLRNLGDLISSDPEINAGSFFPFGYSSGSMNGRQYALPFEVNPKLMAVNKTLLQREGYDVPSLDWKWNDFYDLCYHLTRDLDGDGQKDIFGVCNYKWTDAVYSNGARLFDRDGSKAYFNDAGVIEAVKFMQRLNDLNNDIKLTKDDFDMGKVAFMPLTFAEYKTYTTYPYKIEKYMDLNWSFITLPAGPSGDNVSVADSLLMGISSNSSHEQLAYRLLKTFTADSEIQLDIYNYGHGASALKEAASSPQVEKIMQDKMAENDMNYDSNLIIQVLDNSMFCPVFSKYDELMALANNTIEHIISEDENAESSLRKFQRDILKLIE